MYTTVTSGLACYATIHHPLQAGCNTAGQTVILHLREEDREQNFLETQFVEWRCMVGPGASLFARTSCAWMEDRMKTWCYSFVWAGGTSSGGSQFSCARGPGRWGLFICCAAGPVYGWPCGRLFCWNKQSPPLLSLKCWTIKKNHLFFPNLNGDRQLPVETVSLESGDTETCLRVERSPGHQGPLAHPAPKKHHLLINL